MPGSCKGLSQAAKGSTNKRKREPHKAQLKKEPTEYLDAKSNDTRSRHAWPEGICEETNRPTPADSTSQNEIRAAPISNPRPIRSSTPQSQLPRPNVSKKKQRNAQVRAPYLPWTCWGVWERKSDADRERKPARQMFGQRREASQELSDSSAGKCWKSNTRRVCCAGCTLQRQRQGLHSILRHSQRRQGFSSSSCALVLGFVFMFVACFGHDGRRRRFFSGGQQSTKHHNTQDSITLMQLRHAMPCFVLPSTARLCRHSPKAHA